MLDMSRMKHKAGPGSSGLDDLWSHLWSALSLVTLVPVVQLGCPHVPSFFASGDPHRMYGLQPEHSQGAWFCSSIRSNPDWIHCQERKVAKIESDATTQRTDLIWHIQNILFTCRQFTDTVFTNLHKLRAGPRNYGTSQQALCPKCCWMRLNGFTVRSTMLRAAQSMIACFSLIRYRARLYHWTHCLLQTHLILPIPCGSLQTYLFHCFRHCSNQI